MAGDNDIKEQAGTVTVDDEQPDISIIKGVPDEVLALGEEVGFDFNTQLGTTKPGTNMQYQGLRRIWKYLHDKRIRDVRLRHKEKPEICASFELVLQSQSGGKKPMENSSYPKAHYRPALLNADRGIVEPASKADFCTWYEFCKTFGKHTNATQSVEIEVNEETEDALRKLSEALGVKWKISQADIQAESGDVMVDGKKIDHASWTTDEQKFLGLGSLDLKAKEIATVPGEWGKCKAEIVNASHNEVNAEIERNVLFFGPPGTGKSYRVQEVVRDDLSVEEEDVFRVTFHPETSYGDFVGSVMPVTDKSVTTYEFQPGPFMRAMERAKRKASQNVMLVIEELNRANCAAAFGDVFQLLDRDKDGVSQYAIALPTMMRKWAFEEGKILEKEDEPLVLPSNLYLIGTMNSSDQSLFPVDAAFLRRWNMKYIGVSAGNDSKTQWVPVADKKYVKWSKFREALNEWLVKNLPGHGERYQIGRYFVKASGDDGKVSHSDFKSKILYYLWHHCLKNNVKLRKSLFVDDVDSYEGLEAKYADDKNVFRGKSSKAGELSGIELDVCTHDETDNYEEPEADLNEDATNDVGD